MKCALAPHKASPGQIPCPQLKACKTHSLRLCHQPKNISRIHSAKTRLIVKLECSKLIILRNDAIPVPHETKAFSFQVPHFLSIALQGCPVQLLSSFSYSSLLHHRNTDAAEEPFAELYICPLGLLSFLRLVSRRGVLFLTRSRNAGKLLANILELDKLINWE